MPEAPPKPRPTAAELQAIQQLQLRKSRLHKLLPQRLEGRDPRSKGEQIYYLALGNYGWLHCNSINVEDPAQVARLPHCLQDLDNMITLAQEGKVN